MDFFQCKNKTCFFGKPYEYENLPDVCPECGSKSYTLTFNWRNENWTNADNPRWSDALGINPNQIPEFKKEFGDLMTFDKEGRCLVKNRHHKKQLMKARGFDELS